MAINKQSDLQLQAILRSRQEPRTARGDSPDAITGAAGATIVQTITNGDTTHAPSGDAVYDALALKQSTTLADGYMWIGNGSNVAAAVLMSGDVTISNAGVTAIGAGKVTNAMLAGSIAASKLVGSDIATLGTVTTGTWNATAIASGYGGTGFTTYATGDLIYASAANTLSKLAATTDGYVLTLAAGVPTWAAASGGGATARTAGDAGTGAVAYNGTTQSAGQFDGGTTAPAHTTRLNFDGYFYSTRFYGDATGLTGTASSLTAGNATTLATSRNIDGQAFNGSADITVIAPSTHAATSKTTPVDADELPLADSAASYALKKLTWANLKATAKTYFDTVHAAIGAITASGLTVSATSKILARKSSGSGAIEEASLSEILDFIGSAAQGDVLVRGTSAWQRGSPVSAGYVWTDNGPGNTPSFQSPSVGSAVSQYDLPQVFNWHLGRGNVLYWSYEPNGTASTGFGYKSTSVAVGSFAGPAIADTSLFTRSAQAVSTSAATAGSTSFYSLGNAVADRNGGFLLCMRGGVADAATVANSRWFMGLRASMASPGNVEPSTFTDCVGIGCDAGETTLRIFSNDSSGSSSNRVDLGANFPSQTLSTDVYKLELYCAPGASTIYYRVTRENTGDVASGTLTTDLPTASTFMGGQWFRNNGTTALAVKISLMTYHLKWNTQG